MIDPHSPSCDFSIIIPALSSLPIEFLAPFPRPRFSGFRTRILSRINQLPRTRSYRFEANDGEEVRRGKIQILYPCDPRIITRANESLLDARRVFLNEIAILIESYLRNLRQCDHRIDFLKILKILVQSRDRYDSHTKIFLSRLCRYEWGSLAGLVARVSINVALRMLNSATSITSPLAYQ